MNVTKTIPSLNGIRAICILLVLGSHTKFAPGFSADNTPAWNYFFNGALGVTIFFVLSGFLITHLLMKEVEKTQSISLRNFYIRRMIRIFPVYYTLLFVYLVLQVGGILHFPLSNWFTSLTYTKNFGFRNWEDSHLWSLAVEEQFYLFWPILFKFLVRKRLVLFALSIVAICPLIRLTAALAGNTSFLKFSLFANVDGLMIGCLAALYLPALVHLFRKYNQNTIRVVAVVAIVMAWYLELSGIAQPLMVSVQRTIVGIGASTLIISLGFFHTGLGFQTLNTKLLNQLGILSYSIYIWQQMFFSWRLAPLSNLPLNFLFILITAFLSYYLIEKPFLGLKSRFVREKKPVEALVIPGEVKINVMENAWQKNLAKRTR